MTRKLTSLQVWHPRGMAVLALLTVFTIHAIAGQLLAEAASKSATNVWTYSTTYNAGGGGSFFVYNANLNISANYTMNYYCYSCPGNTSIAVAPTTIGETVTNAYYPFPIQDAGHYVNYLNSGGSVVATLHESSFQSTSAACQAGAPSCLAWTTNTNETISGPSGSARYYQQFFTGNSTTPNFSGYGNVTLTLP